MTKKKYIRDNVNCENVCSKSINNVNCKNIKESSECVDSSNVENGRNLINCHNIAFSINCVNCLNCMNVKECYDCINCDNCIRVIGGRGSRYMVFDIQLNEEEFDLIEDYFHECMSKTIVVDRELIINKLKTLTLV